MPAAVAPEADLAAPPARETAHPASGTQRPHQTYEGEFEDDLGTPPDLEDDAEPKGVVGFRMDVDQDNDTTMLFHYEPHQ